MRSLLSMFTLISAISLSACGDKATDDTATGDSPTDDSPAAAATYDLELTGSGFTPHAGNTITAAVVDATETVVDTQTAVMGDDGELSMVFADALEEGESYHVDWYADFNDNGLCDAAPDDHQWSVSIDAVTDDVVVTYDHDTEFADVCSTFE